MSDLEKQFLDIQNLIDKAKTNAYRAVNKELINLIGILVNI